jgi:PKD domain
MRTAFVAVVMLALLLGAVPIRADSTPGMRASAYGGDAGIQAPADRVLMASGMGAEPAASVTISRVSATPSIAEFDWTASTSLLFSSYALEQSTSSASGPWTVVSNVTASASDNSSWVGGQTPGASAWWQVITWTMSLLTYAPTASNVIEATQPTLSYLTHTTPLSTEIDLNWTNNASYGGDITFGNYTVYQSTAGGAPHSIASIASESTATFLVTGLSSGTGYAFYVVTKDDATSSVQVGGSYTTDSNTVNVGTPEALAVSATAQPSSVDVGQTLSLTCVAVGGDTPYSFAWTFGDGGNGTGAVVSHVYALSGPETATCTVTDSSHTTAAGPAAIIVSVAPTVSALVNHLDAAPSTLLSFSANARGGPGTYTSYLWNFGDGSSGSGVSVDRSYANAGRFVASVAVTDGNGGVAVGTVAIDISAIEVSTASNRTLGIPQTSFGFSSSASGGGGGPYNYTWAFGDGGTGYGAAPSHLYRTAGNYTPSVTVTDALGGAQLSSLPTIRIDADLSSSIVVTVQRPQPGQVVTLYAMVTGGSGAYNCTWAFGDGTTGYGCDGHHSWTKVGNFLVNLTVTDPIAGSQTVNTTVSVEKLSGTGTGEPGSAGSSGPLGVPVWAWYAIVIAILAALAATVFVVAYRRRLDQLRSSSAKSGPDTCVNCGAAIGSRTVLCPKCGKAARVMSSATSSQKPHS